MYIAKAQQQQPNREIVNTRKPEKLPDTNSEPIQEYVTALQPDSPFECITILGLNFQKSIQTEKASLVENQGKYFEHGVLVRSLTEKQVAALKNRAEQVIMKHPGGEEKASKYLILTPLSGYNPINFGSTATTQVNETTPESEPIEPEKLKQELYETQRKRK